MMMRQQQQQQQQQNQMHMQQGNYPPPYSQHQQRMRAPSIPFQQGTGNFNNDQSQFGMGQGMKTNMQQVSRNIQNLKNPTEKSHEWNLQFSLPKNN